MTLTTLFTNIANAIRSKKGTSGLIQAENFATEISNIPTSSSVELPDGTKFINSTCKTFPDGFDYSNITNGENMFFQCYYLKNITVSIPKLTTANTMFNADRSLEICHLRNTGLCESFVGCFSGCTALTEVEVDTSNCSDFRSMFYNCSSLVELPQLYMDNSTGRMQNMVTYCSMLSNTSIQNVLKMLDYIKNYTYTKTLAYIGLSQSQCAVAQTFPEWDSLSSKGWTTGY